MKVRITKMPVRINGKRYLVGDEVEVDKATYTTMKSICILIEEDPIEETEEVEEETEEEENLEIPIEETIEYKQTTKDKIMEELVLAEINFSPTQSKLELYKLLHSKEE